MCRPLKAIVTKKRTVFVYSQLWKASETHLKAGQLAPTGGSWLFMSSAIATAFAFQAYLNHIGPQIIVAWAKLERLPPLSKFDLLCELLELSFPKGRRPLQTIEQLFEFRNSLAHGRTTILTPDDSHRDIDDTIDKFQGDMPRTSWELLIKDAAFAERAREDTNAILEKLQRARPDPKEPLFTPQHSEGGATPI